MYDCPITLKVQVHRGTLLIRKRHHLGVGICVGPYGGPRRVAFSYERGTPIMEGHAHVFEGAGERRYAVPHPFGFGRRLLEAERGQVPG